MSQLSGGSRRTAKAAATAAATAFEEGEVAEMAVACRYLGHDAVAVLTNQRLLLVNSREWAPEISSIADLGNVGVEGWIDKRAGTLRLTDGSTQHVIDRINDTGSAEALANALRAR